jgi:uridine kinase
VVQVVYVVAVTGVSGAGKSSVIRRSIELLGEGAALYFDDYRESSVYPADLKDWVARGADVNEFKTPHFSADLRRMRAELEADLIFVEEPFGKMRREMAGLIELAIYIEVPPDILLARRLLRDATTIEKVVRDLKYHLATGHDMDALAAA